MESSGEHIKPYTPEPGDAGSVFIDNGTPLPDTYGDNCLVIMARDPRTIFVYWDVQAERFEPLRKDWGHKLDQAVTVLRVYDVTDQPKTPETSFFDLEVSQDARQSYVKLPQPGRRHMIEFGLRLPDGTFISILSSNVVLVPNGRVSDDIDAKWVSVRSAQEYEAWEKVLQNVDLGRGSADFSRQMAQRWQFLKSVFSMGVAPSSMPSSGSTHHE
jgi:hypothetical protein